MDHIAIIGTGKMAAGLARRLTAAQIPVVIGSRSAEAGARLAQAVGATFAGLAQAAEQGNVVVLAVPFAAAGETIRALGNLDGKILVDITNPITPDYMALTIGHTTSAGEEIQKLAPGAKVVKAFNTIFSQIFDLDPQGRSPRIQVFYAGDDKAACERVGALIGQMGYEPVYAGGLGNARYLEPVGELNIHLGFALGHGPLVAPAWIKAG